MTPTGPSDTTTSTDDSTTVASESTTSTTEPSDVRTLVARYFDPDSESERSELGREIASLASVEAFSALLHESVLFDPIAPGRSGTASPIGFNQNRQIVVRTPEGYDPTRPWPLIVAYHGWGGEPDVVINRIEDLLGPAIENYVVAAPDDYRQTVIDAPPPVSSEHVSVWRRVRQRWHVDANRVYLAGYSLGGDTVITLASMHPGHIAGGLAMAAGASYPTDVDGLLERFLPQLAPVEILHVYGADDTFNIVGLNFRPQDITLAQQGELMSRLTTNLGLDSYSVLRLEGVGHSGVYPTTEEALTPLTAARGELPSRFSHSFRYIHQADAFWIEGHEWLGDGWFTAWPEVTPGIGESDEDALTRTIHELLGRVEGTIDGQTITVETSHVADFTVWLHDGMIDWYEPIELIVDGVAMFEGMIEPSVEIALAQALRTSDFDRLRFAGIRVNMVDGTAHLVSPTDEFPDIVRGVTF